MLASKYTIAFSNVTQSNILQTFTRKRKLPFGNDTIRVVNINNASKHNSCSHKQSAKTNEPIDIYISIRYEGSRRCSRHEIKCANTIELLISSSGFYRNKAKDISYKINGRCVDELRVIVDIDREITRLLSEDIALGNDMFSDDMFSDVYGFIAS